MTARDTANGHLSEHGAGTITAPDVASDLDFDQAFLDVDDHFCHLKDGGRVNGEVRPFLCGLGFGVKHGAGYFPNEQYDGRSNCPVCGRPICPDCIQASNLMKGRNGHA